MGPGFLRSRQRAGALRRGKQLHLVTTRIDVRLNGEFVPGAESWVNFSLRTREHLDGIQHKAREVGDREGHDVADVPRPTDRFFTISTFFQDYLRSNKNIPITEPTVGTGLPFGIPENNIVYRNPYRFTPITG